MAYNFKFGAVFVWAFWGGVFGALIVIDDDVGWPQRLAVVAMCAFFGGIFGAARAIYGGGSGGDHRDPGPDDLDG